MNLSKSLYCNVTGTCIEWNVKGGSNLVALFKFYLPLKDQQVRMQLQILVSESSDSLWSQLVTYDDPLFIPLSCQCTLIKKSQASMN